MSSSMSAQSSRSAESTPIGETFSPIRSGYRFKVGPCAGSLVESAWHSAQGEIHLTRVFACRVVNFTPFEDTYVTSGNLGAKLSQANRPSSARVRRG